MCLQPHVWQVGGFSFQRSLVRRARGSVRFIYKRAERSEGPGGTANGFSAALSIIRVSL